MIKTLKKKTLKVTGKMIISGSESVSSQPESCFEIRVSTGACLKLCFAVLVGCIDGRTDPRESTNIGSNFSVCQL